MKIHWFFKTLIIFLTILVSLSLFYFTLPRILPVQRLLNNEVYGLIFSDQIWEGEIRVVGDIYSLTNSKITIMPGTKVLVSIKGDRSNLSFLPWQRKNGINTGLLSHGVGKGEPFWDEGEKIQIHLNKLNILGENQNPVVISSNSILPSPYDFNVLQINSGNIRYAIFSNYRRFEIGSGVRISDVVFADIGECALCLYSGKPVIMNNTFEKSIKESIWVSRASPEIHNNLFINSFGDGIRIDSRRLSSPVITENTFEMPKGFSIDIVSGGEMQEGLIAKNIFAGSTELKIACDSKLRIRDNVILGRISFSNGCEGQFTFGPNFWGTPDSTVVLKEKILNKNSSFIIKIPVVLLSPSKDAGRKE